MIDKGMENEAGMLQGLIDKADKPASPRSGRARNRP